MDAVVGTAREVYVGHDEEESRVDTRISLSFDRVSKTKQVVDTATSKRRFVRGTDRRDIVGRAAFTRVTREVREVIDLRSEPEGESESESDEEVGNVCDDEVEEESEEEADEDSDCVAW